MLNNDPRAAQFAGGTVPGILGSRFLPLLARSGQRHNQLVHGTYYSKPVLYCFDPDEGIGKIIEGSGSPDPGADADSQG